MKNKTFVVKEDQPVADETTTILSKLEEKSYVDKRLLEISRLQVEASKLDVQMNSSALISAIAFVTSLTIFVSDEKSLTVGLAFSAGMAIASIINKLRKDSVKRDIAALEQGK